MEEAVQSVSVDQQPPHVVLFPFPLQGHINPFMNLAKVLSAHGLYITFVNTESVQARLADCGVIMADDGNKSHMNIRFETVPDGLPSQQAGVSQYQNLPELSESMKANAHIHLGKVMEKLRDLPNVPPVSFIVLDGLLSKTQYIANDYGVPRVVFWPTSAFGFTAFFSIPLLIDK